MKFNAVIYCPLKKEAYNHDNHFINGEKLEK